MFILHGENTVQSRDALYQHISTLKQQETTLTRIEAKSLDLPTLENTLGSSSLFAEKKSILIEDLHSLPKSKKKEELIEYLSTWQKLNEHNEETQVILWEKRQVTATMLKKFPGAKAQEFKVTNSLFAWLDTFSGASLDTAKKMMILLLQQAVKSDGDVMCFVMLIRQVRLLLEMKEQGGVAGLAPFMAGKLKKQASTFSLDQLYGLHRKLLEIDISQKTSKSLLGLSRELELLLITL